MRSLTFDFSASRPSTLIACAHACSHLEQQGFQR
jgi:hypothetical protein